MFRPGKETCDLARAKHTLKKRKADRERPNCEPQSRLQSDPEQRFFSLPRTGLAFLMFFVVGFVVFHKGFPSLMVYDSVALLENKAELYATHDLLRILSIAPARPLFTLSLYLNYLLTGMEPYYFRVLNTAILAGAGLALAWLIIILLEFPSLRVPGTPNEKRAIGLFLGLLFIVHPLQSYTVLYVWQREAIMACFFYFSSLAVYLGARSGRFRHVNLAYVLAAAFFFAGLLSKENVATLPIIMFLAEAILLRQSSRQIVRGSFRIILLTLPILTIYLLMAYSFHGTETQHARGMVERLIAEYGYVGISPVQVLLTESRVFFAYLLMILAPFHEFLEFIKAQPISRSILEPPVTIFAVAAIFGLIGTGVALVRKYPLLSFGIFFCIIVVAPESALIPQYLFFGYRAILPMAGTMMIMAYVLAALLAWGASQSRMWPVRPALWAALTCTLLTVAAVSFAEAAKWSPLQFWKTPADRLPEYSSNLEQWAYMDIVVNGSLELARVGKYPEAIDLLGKACSLSPDARHDLSRFGPQSDRQKVFQTAAENLMRNFPGQEERTSAVWMNLGSSLVALGDKTGFELSMKKAVEIKPKLAEAHFRLAEFYMVEDRLAAAWDHMQKASDISPSDQRYINGLGKILFQQGKASEAVPYFERTIETAPGFDEAYYNLGEAYVSMMMFREAELNFRKALQLNGRNWKAHNSLGLLLAQSGSTADAISHFNTALSLSPRNWRIYNNLGVMLAKSGDYRNAAIQFQKSLEINPQDLSAKANLARLRHLIESPALK